MLLFVKVKNSRLRKILVVHENSTVQGEIDVRVEERNISVAPSGSHIRTPIFFINIGNNAHYFCFGQYETFTLININALV